jgi:hypothetical protein
MERLLLKLGSHRPGLVDLSAAWVIVCSGYAIPYKAANVRFLVQFAAGSWSNARVW